ncbi:MAG: hypothetical protein KatS3mg060_3517 [Dehalococcoidia bacterium]|nr:MAG: hypothetical protein KatS3mg060_3517 [Dehalococcoidia bacterium]
MRRLFLWRSRSGWQSLRSTPSPISSPPTNSSRRFGAFAACSVDAVGSSSTSPRPTLRRGCATTICSSTLGRVPSTASRCTNWWRGRSTKSPNCKRFDCCTTGGAMASHPAASVVSCAYATSTQASLPCCSRSPGSNRKRGTGITNLHRSTRRGPRLIAIARRGRHAMTVTQVRALVDGGKLLARLGARAEAEAVLRAALTLDADTCDRAALARCHCGRPNRIARTHRPRLHDRPRPTPAPRAGLAWARQRLDPPPVEEPRPEGIPTSPYPKYETEPRPTPRSVATDSRPISGTQPTDAPLARLQALLDPSARCARCRRSGWNDPRR